MRIVVCNRLTEYLGVEILSALLKQAGHEVQLVFAPDVLAAAFVRALPEQLSGSLDSAQRTADRVVSANPDLVLFPSEINSFDWCARVGAAIKQRRPAVWLLHGGFEATAKPQECIARAGVDMLCQGEGDLAVPELIEALAAGAEYRSIPNIWVKDEDGTVHRNSPRPLVADLDSLPYPDKGLYYDVLPGLQREYMCVASRGCHWACSFCFYTTLYSLYGQEGFLRTRSPQHVIGELELAKSKYQIEYVVFHDDIFPSSLKWLKEFAPLYRDKVGLPFSCITHPQLIRDETAELLGQMGCKYVIMGAQTVNEGSRAPEVINRTESSEEIAAAVERLKRQGIFVLLDHIFGIPGETLDDQEAALRFYVEAGADVIKPFFLSYFPGTDLSKRAEGGPESLGEEPPKPEEHWDHFMFKGRVSEQDYAAYNLAYALFPLLGERGRKTMLKAGLHHKLAPLGRLPGLGNIILFPRMAASLFSQRDIRPKLYLNYLRTILGYEIRSHLRDRRG